MLHFSLIEMSYVKNKSYHDLPKWLSQRLYKILDLNASSKSCPGVLRPSPLRKLKNLAYWIIYQRGLSAAPKFPSYSWCFPPYSTSNITTIVRINIMT
jgi:hypothetical protein